MTKHTTLLKRFKSYWAIRNGKFKEQLKPTIKFLSKHLRKTIPRGECSEKIINGINKGNVAGVK